MAGHRHTLVALVEDKPGVLNRISGLFRRRGFNIASLAVGQSETPALSRMTIVVEGNEEIHRQAARQLKKLIGVVEVYDITDRPMVSRELSLIKVKSAPEERSEIISIAGIFRAHIIDVALDSLVIEVTGDDEKIQSLYNLLKPFGVQEIMRTGRVAMVRGSGTINVNGRRPQEPVHYEDIGGV